MKWLEIYLIAGFVASVRSTILDRKSLSRQIRNFPFHKALIILVMVIAFCLHCIVFPYFLFMEMRNK